MRKPATVPLVQIPIPFDEFCTAFRVTPAERIELVRHLAMLRFLKTMDTLGGYGDDNQRAGPSHQQEQG